MSTAQIIERGTGADGLNDEGLGDPFELMTAGEVATLLRVTKAWVYTQTRARKIPHVSLGRYVRYRRSAVLEWIEELEQEPVGGTFNRTPRRRTEI
jgi:excisionase family DNA binding protein